MNPMVQVAVKGSDRNRPILADASGRLLTVALIAPLVVISPGGVAYTANDAVGGVKSVQLDSNYTLGILESLVVLDGDAQAQGLQVVFFSDNPSAATLADNGAAALSTDFAKVTGAVVVAAGDYVTVAADRVATKTGLNIPLKATAAGLVYFAVITTGTPTYGASALQVQLGIRQVY